MPTLPEVVILIFSEKAPADKLFAEPKRSAAEFPYINALSYHN